MQFGKILTESWMMRRSVILTSTMIAMAFCFYLQTSDNAESLENNIGRPYLFTLRERLGLAPKLDPRIVIYAYDDKAATKLGRPELLSGEEWDRMIGAIADHKPRAILVDMIFANIRKDPEDVLRMNLAFDRASPVYTAAAARPARGLARPYEKSDSIFRAKPSEWDFIRKYSFMGQNMDVMGPAENLPKLREHIGQINFTAPGFFSPVVVFPPEHRLKALALSFLDDSQYRVDGEHLYVDGQPVYLNERGETFVNWLPKKDLYGNTFKILDLVEIRSQEKFSDKIKPDSIVFFLPLMFTGNADIKETFAGLLPGGFAQVSALNSVLSGKWLRNIDAGFGGIIAAVALGLLSGLVLRIYSMIGIWLAVNVVYLTSVTVAFLFGGFVLEFVTPWLGFNLVLVPVIIHTQVFAEIKNLRVHDALSGIVPPKMLEQIARSPEKFSIETSERTITVMFVDFVGFSLVSERYSGNLVFETLKQLLGNLGDIVHEHQGIVDKSLGDGLLGVFGFDPLTNEESSTHAEEATRCAIAIQRYMAKLCTGYDKTQGDLESIIFGSRVGLSSGTSFIGNVGEKGRLDLTVIGFSVNMGKRYEDACESFKVMMGESTHQSLSEDLKAMTIRRDLQIKHHEELICAYELDPFIGLEKDYLDAVKGERAFTESLRMIDRLTVPPSQTWVVIQDGVEVGHIHNYSSEGLNLSLNKFYACKVNLTFDVGMINRNDGRIVKKFVQCSGSVKWGRKTDKGFTHGFAMTPESQMRFKEFLT